MMRIVFRRCLRLWSKVLLIFRVYGVRISNGRYLGVFCACIFIDSSCFDKRWMPTWIHLQAGLHILMFLEYVLSGIMTG